MQKNMDLKKLIETADDLGGETLTVCGWVKQFVFQKLLALLS